MKHPLNPNAYISLIAWSSRPFLNADPISGDEHPGAIFAIVAVHKNFLVPSASRAKSKKLTTSSFVGAANPPMGIDDVVHPQVLDLIFLPVLAAIFATQVNHCGDTQLF